MTSTESSPPGCSPSCRPTCAEASRRSSTTIEEEKWPLATSYARARFLLTIQLNDNDPEVVGAAFFELGLVPDLTLFADPALLRTRTGQNVRQMQLLARPDRPERQRVVELGLTDVTFRQKLAKLVAETGLDNLREWARRIVVDRANWPLSFDNWPLPAITETEAIKLTVGELVLPRVGHKPEHADHPLLQNLDGQLFLLAGPQGTNQFAVSFEVQTDPRQIPALARFSAQIVSEDSGPTGVVKSVKPATTGRTGYKVTFGKLRSAGLEQGWHFVRILPQDHDGIALPVMTDDTGPHQPYESERFLVVAQQPEGGDDLDDTLPPDKTEIYAGVTQALRAFEFRALADGRDWRAVQCRSIDWKGPQRQDVTHCVHRSARTVPRTSRFPRCCETSSGRRLPIQGAAAAGRCGWRAESQSLPFLMKWIFPQLRLGP